MQKIDFTQYKTKEDFLKDFPIIDGSLKLYRQQINDDDLKHILELIGEEPSLKNLDLSFNELTTLPVGGFKGLSSLRILYLNRNKLTILLVGVFEGLSSLEILFLNSNELTTLLVGVFEGLSSLEILYLDFNELTTLPKSLLARCLISKDNKCIFVDDVDSNQETHAIAESNVIDVLNAKVQDIDKEIAKLQSDKENI